MKFLILFATLCLVQVAMAEKIVNCYYGTWSNYRPGDGKFQPQHIDPTLCTHLSYSFFGISDQGDIKVLDSWLDNNDGLANIKKSVALKSANPNLKVLAVVGGWNEGSAKYSAVAADATKRARFAQTAVDFILKHGFDGLDLDWEYPTDRGGVPADRANFVILLKELKAALSKHNLVLGIAVSASVSKIQQAYDVANIAKNVDFINVMTYDLGGHWDNHLSHNAPLKGQGGVNVENGIKAWLDGGAPSNKVILGLPFYGRTFTMSNPQQTTPGSPSSGAGSAGPYTREAGYLGYNEICLNNWKTIWDSEAQAAYAFSGNQWVGYDNKQSIELKMDLVKSLNLGGAMIWSIETDDFLGKCGEKYPLLKAVNKGLGGASGNTGSGSTSSPRPPSPAPSPAPTATPAPAPTPAPGPAPGPCTADGFFAVKPDCTRYYRCVGSIRYDYECQSGLKFDEATSICNWANTVTC